MLLNLSNHPSSNWQPEQIKAAKEVYGEIQDLPFPNIPPQWDEMQVQQLAKEYAEKCITLFNANIVLPHAIHIMGELTFCYAFVKMMEPYPYPCLAATTERIVEILPNGEKKSSFKFLKFRNYEC